MESTLVRGTFCWCPPLRSHWKSSGDHLLQRRAQALQPPEPRHPTRQLSPSCRDQLVKYSLLQRQAQALSPSCLGQLVSYYLLQRQAHALQQPYERPRPTRRLSPSWRNHVVVRQLLRRQAQALQHQCHHLCQSLP